ncbi:MAG: hypothetical protein WBL23_06865 [Salinisphaera sp.]|uniref:hypothetical protein n=1 Tax=Salinisphaera sp. TaxID=1914330 RepID=UPI003C7DFEC4
MLKLLDIPTDSAESTFDPPLVRIENRHHLVGGYRATRAGRDAHLPAGGARGVARAVGPVCGVFQIIDGARAHRPAEKIC